MYRLRGLIVLLLTFSLLAAACGSDDDDSEASPDDAAGTTVGDDGDDGDDGDGDSAPPADLTLVSDGTLTVCSDTPYEPFEFEGDDGEFTGYDVDLLDAIAGDLGLELDIRTTPFDTIIPAMLAGDCDLIGSAMTITDERAEQVNFSDPYFDADQSLLVPADSDVTELADLAGERIGVQSGTTGADYATENAPDGADVVEFPDASALFAAISSGDVAAVLQDFPVNAYRATQDDSVTVSESFPTGEQYGFAIDPENEGLLTAVNEGLDALRDDGRFDEIFATYFG